jgi:hypothetical protein
MSRAATLRRTIGSITEHLKDNKPHSRVPLSRISNNRILRRPPADSLLKKAPSETLAAPCSQSPELFHFADLPIGEKDESQDIADLASYVYRTARQCDLSMPPMRFEQRSITMKDRNLLIDSMCRYHSKLELMTNTFYRFIGILDRFLSVEDVPKPKLKLIGCAALLLASKVEDIEPCQASDLETLAEREFTMAELLSAEAQIITAIDYQTTFATPLFYLTHFLRINENSPEDQLRARYILEICQTHEKFHGVGPALTASVAIMVVRELKNLAKWTCELAGYTGFTAETLEPYAATAYAVSAEANREESRFIKRKYSSERFMRVARITIP